MPAHVLLVEDDPSVREATALLLERGSINVRCAATGEDALQMANGESFDAIVLDLMLPGIDGFEVCRRLRQHSSVPVVMLTARTDVEDIVAGLELGADDYLVKPFDGRELLARLHAVLRREFGDLGDTTSTVRGLTVDVAAHQVLRGNESIELTAMEFKLLLELIRHAGQVRTREVLLDRVWGYDYLGDSRLVDMAVKRLRGKLGPDPDGGEYISTVRGVGYRFERDLDVG